MPMRHIRLDYPKVVTLKKGVLLGSAFFICAVIGGLLFYNLGKAMDAPLQSTKKSSTNTPHRTASSEDMGWFAPNRNNPQQPVPLGTPLVGVAPQDKSQLVLSSVSDKAVTQPLEKNTQPINEDLQKAMRAPISSNQIQGELSRGITPIASSPILSDKRVTAMEENESQSPQKAFLQSNKNHENPYLQSTLENPISPFELQAGSIIPGILITGLNSDLPGSLVGQVRSPVFDTMSGNHILIPQGAKLVGLYNSQIIYGQERVLVVWRRVIFPNGQSIDLGGMQGVDVSGYAGFTDKVNNHYGKLLRSVLLMSVLSAGAQLSQPQQSAEPFTAPSVNQMLAQSLGTNIANVGTALVQRDLTVQPTLEIRPGYLFNIMVTKDIVFPNAYDESIIG